MFFDGDSMFPSYFGKLNVYMLKRILNDSCYAMLWNQWNKICCPCSLSFSWMLSGADFESYLLYSFQLRSLSSPNEIVHNEDILRIFLMACEVRTVKLSVIGLSCLQKLITHDAVAPSALKEILSTLKNVCNYEYFHWRWLFLLWEKQDLAFSLPKVLVGWPIQLHNFILNDFISLFFKARKLSETLHLYNKIFYLQKKKLYNKIMLLCNLSNENKSCLYL